MELNSDLYDDAARVYTRIIERDSAAAAAAIEQIHVTFGVRTALRAALIIQVMRIEISQGNYPPQIRFYAYLLKDYPEAVPLLKHAIRDCLLAWGIDDLHVQLNIDSRLFS